MILHYVKFLLEVVITILRMFITSKAETIEESDYIWFSFLYQCKIYVRTIEEILTMPVITKNGKKYRIGISKKHFTDQDKIDRGIWYPIPTIEDVETGEVIDINMTPKEYNGDIPLSPDCSDIFDIDEKGFITPDAQKSISVYKIASVKNKKYSGMTNNMMNKRSAKGKQGIDWGEMSEVAKLANAKTLLQDWVNVCDAETGEIVTYSRPYAEELLLKHTKIAEKIVSIAQDEDNYTEGASGAKIEATAEK